MLPIPPEEEETEDTTLDSDSTYVNFDEKWNVEEEEVEVEKKEEEQVKISKEMPATMVLVIGIILGAFVAMVLIVIIGNFAVVFIPQISKFVFHCVRILELD